MFVLQVAQSVSAVYTDSEDGSNDEGRPSSGHHKNHSSSATQSSRYIQGGVPLAAASSLPSDSHSLSFLFDSLLSSGLLRSRHQHQETVARLKWGLGCVASVDKYVCACSCMRACV